MTYLYIFLVSAAASIDTSHIASIFKDVIFLIVLVSGIGMSLTLDHNRPDVPQKFTIGYFLFSFFASVFFSFLSVAAFIQFDFGKFWFYILIGVTATVSPKFAREILPLLPEALKKGFFEVLSALFTYGADKFKNKGNDNN